MWLIVQEVKFFRCLQFRIIRRRTLGLLLALGIVQIDAKDQQLIDRIKAKMGKWQAEDKKALEKAKVGFSFQDLEEEFESRSRSSSPKGSDDE